MKIEEILTKSASNLEAIRASKPLVHHMTNLVVMNDTANITLHIGALPVMAHAREEVAEMVAISGCLLLNPGTLTAELVDSMLIAGKRANELGVPVVLDPVGAGATNFRTSSNMRILSEVKVSIMRGNAGEIAALSGAGGQVKGVESVGDLADPLSVAKKAAKDFGLTVAMTGARDIITDGKRALGIDNGDRWLTTLTGTGCMSTTMVASFAAVESDPLLACAGALIAYGIAAERAAEKAKGPATFKEALMDGVYNLTADQIKEGGRLALL
ncbi:MAG: hydroxyethylthiazole kinase [Actinomycetota bacterium]|nr:hydroxyethylthiazole kinase [Actinomycetota bacterium]